MLLIFDRCEYQSEFITGQGVVKVFLAIRVGRAFPETLPLLLNR
jgi:hypothetical protein